MTEETIEPCAVAKRDVMRRAQLEVFRDPWPSPQSAWSDPPWVLEGRVVTAWFMVDRRAVSQILSPDLLPRNAQPRVRMRVRFYDVLFTAQGAGQREGSTGRFREAVVAFSGSVGSVDGEVSLFMWTDDDTYMMWGREVFGWPLERAQFHFEESLWAAGELPGVTCRLQGAARARCRTGELGLEVSEAVPSEQSLPASTWITPRRVLRRAGLDPELREVLLVRPKILQSGQRYEARGNAWLDFRPDHALSGVSGSASAFEIVDGFRISVGADVEVVSRVANKGIDR